MKQPKVEDRLNPKPETNATNGWSQFQEWAGMDWFGKKPLLPPKEEKITHERANKRT
jgi:hypothetical protein